MFASVYFFPLIGQDRPFEHFLNDYYFVMQNTPTSSRPQYSDTVAGINKPNTPFSIGEIYLNKEKSYLSLEERVQQLESQNNIMFYLLGLFRDYLPDLARELLPSSVFTSLNSSKIEKPHQGSEAHRDDPLTERNKCHITRREMEVLQLLSEGFCAKEIASKLFISETTVITHKKNLKEKFCVKNTAELMRKTSHFLLPK
jgi:DNA-binding CsgD family transcriptional regulator